MSVAAQRSPQEREAAHEAKIIDVIRSRLREARRSRATGKLTIEIGLNKGGPNAVYTEIGAVFKILEEF